jgi:hypothetical protein
MPSASHEDIGRPRTTKTPALAILDEIEENPNTTIPSLTRNLQVNTTG